MPAKALKLNVQAFVRRGNDGKAECRRGTALGRLFVPLVTSLTRQLAVAATAIIVTIVYFVTGRIDGDGGNGSIALFPAVSR